MKFSLKNYIRYIRKQHKHIQHIHAFIFAGIITAIVAAVILYTDYGFWHEKYVAKNDVTIETVATSSSVAPESPSEMFSRFWNEAHIQFGNIGSKSNSLLEGKETFSR